MRRLVLVLSLGCAGFVATGAAQPVRDGIPPALRPWIPWALHGHEAELCPLLSGEEKARSCAWPGRLALDLNDRGGNFSQSWRLFADSFAVLPGDGRRWPQNVRINGRPAAPILREGTPVLYLGPGLYNLSGNFVWDGLPESLAVPAVAGLVSLRLRGRDVPFPNRDQASRLWLQDSGAGEEEEDTLAVEVHRRVVDSVPLLLLTRIELAVSGTSREIELARALPEGLIPMSLEGPLPARLEADGRLRLQARPGRWVMTLTGRHDGPVRQLTLQEPNGPWAREEVWVFDARPDVRVVEVEGVPAIDPRQSRLPQSWQSLPAYLLRPGDSMSLVERRRGAEEPTPDRLVLQRVLWLDFGGGGFSIQDVLEGTLSASWRLEMPPPSSLERVVVGGVDQVITRREGSDSAGIELRQGNLLMAAESRISRDSSAIPAVGWNHDFESVSAVLNLPPGWRMAAAFGVDRAPGTWIDRWTLLDFFVVLILALAFRRLWGNLWGILAFAAFLLIYHETGAPTWIFLFVLAAEALRRLLQEGRARRLVQWWLWAGVALLLLQTVPFLVRQIRVGLYPVLERPYASVGQVPDTDRTNLASIGGSSVLDKATQAEIGAVQEFRARQERRPAPPPPAAPVPQASRQNIQELDPSLSVNTGSGLPGWSWSRVQLYWSGPVEAEQRMRFLLLSPAANLLLALLRAALVVLLALRVLGMPGRFWPRRLRAPASAALAVLLTILFTPHAAAQAVPPKDVLDALRDRLLEKPPCYPHCVQISRLLLETGPRTLRGRLEVGAEADAAFPLPGGARQWIPDLVSVDGQSARVFRGGDGRLWVVVAPGRHQALFEGPLPDREVVQLPLPLQPRRVEVRGTAWSVEGLHEDGIAESSLQLIRRQADALLPAESLEPTRLPPFLEVNRTLSLGLLWQVETRVRRLSPLGAPVSVAVPLLTGEAVVTPGARVEDGSVLVSLPPQTIETSWSSRLPVREEISLRAADSLEWTEVWRLDASPLWHTTPQGIPPVHSPQPQAIRVPEWRPWPGEELVLTVDRPAGAEGRSLTFDGSRLSLTPGIRSTDAVLDLAVRSSRGGQHTVNLPQGAAMQSFNIDGQSLPIRQEGAQVTFPVDPGSRQVQLTWREPRGVGLWFRTSDVDLTAPGVNALTLVNFPSNRWILALGGTGAGPAVLFWTLLAVILLVAAGLGQLGWTPLRTFHWALLGIGLSQIPLIAGALVAGWLLALGLRRRHGGRIGRKLLFNAVQIGLGLWTLIALALLFWGLAQGLLGPPEMQIAGNGSTAAQLRWFSDRWDNSLPASWIFSLPLFIYRLAMLAWALWLASALLGWLRWGWESLTEGGGWKTDSP